MVDSLETKEASRIKFKTVSGSQYEIRGNKIRRVNDEFSKRADDVWVTLLSLPTVTVGRPATLILESLSEYGYDDRGGTGEVTVRVTSTVTEVHDV